MIEELRFDLRLIRAPNPSPMTERGTNTYLLGTTQIAVIDPGPNLAGHLEAIESALTPGQFISHVLVTHAHLDHSPLAAPLAERHSVQTWAFGRARDGLSKVMQDFLKADLPSGGEGIDADFNPDCRLANGDVVEGDGWRLTALHTPGHIGNHLCFLGTDYAFSGDHVMGWASSMVSPPDGDLTDFMASCQSLKEACAREGITTLYPGHGAPVPNALARINELISHRKTRESQILDALALGTSTPSDLAKRIYTDVPQALIPAATRNVFAHLIDLTNRALVRPVGILTATAVFELSHSSTKTEK